jgi:hypothetical protein
MEYTYGRPKLGLNRILGTVTISRDKFLMRPEPHDLMCAPDRDYVSTETLSLTIPSDAQFEEIEAFLDK